MDIVQPLAAILEIYLGLCPKENISKFVNERGYSASICLLTSVIVESFIMRARYLNAEEESSKKRSVHEFLAQKYPDFEWGDELVEVFILRDVIAHNHLWEIESSDDHNIRTDIHRKQIHQLTNKWIDKKYRHYVDTEIARTKTLCLHVIPTQIERSDARKILKVANTTLDFLATKEGQRLGIEATKVYFNSRMQNLQNFLGEAIRLSTD